MKYAILLIAALLTGCASYGNKIDANYADSLEKGVTTESEVRQNMGSPMSVGVSPDGDRYYLYMYSYSQAKASSFIPVVGAFAGGADTQTQMLQIWFDDAGLVKSYAFNDTEQEIKTGLMAN